MLKDLSTLMVYVRDMPAAVAFYRDTLGFNLDMESPGWSQFDLGDGLILGLHHAGPDTPKPAGGWQPTFDVDDVLEAKQRVVDAGATIALDLHDVPGGVVFAFTDPDGNEISVMQTGVTCADLGVGSA